MNKLKTKRLPNAFALVVLLEFDDIIRSATNDFAELFQRDHGNIFAPLQLKYSFAMNPSIKK